MTVDYLRVSITDRCDLRCTYCTPMRTSTGAPRDHILSFEEIGVVVRMAASLGVEKVRITGGEPLGRAGVSSLIGDLATIPGLNDRALTTNGTRLLDFVPILAPLGYRVNVHLDTLDQDRYQAVCGQGTPGRVLEGIEAAVRAGLRIKINSVCQPGSDVGDALALVRFGLGVGADVRFIEAMPVSGAWTDAEANATAHAMEEALRAVLGLVPDGLDGVARVYAVPGAVARIGFITPSHARFCAGCRKLRLSSRGILRTCLFAGAGLDLRPFLRELGPDALRQAMQGVVQKKVASTGREGCEIATMVGIGG